MMLQNNVPDNPNWIFTLNWIFIDVIIIILLIFFLIAVKMFKETHRWRSSFSNLDLQYASYKNLLPLPNNHSIFLKKMNLITNKIHQISRPIIVILRTNTRKKLNHILTEGLSSYGFTVIQMRIKMKPCKGCDFFDISIKNEIKYLISSVLNHLFQSKLISEKKYSLMNYSKSDFPYISLINDDNNQNLILINPKLSQINLEYFRELVHKNNKANKLNIIFSKRSTLFFKNKNYRSYMNNKSPVEMDQIQLKVIENARGSFKYYETILLSLIIELIKNMD